MRRGLALVAILCLVVTGSALARPTSAVPVYEQSIPGTMPNDLPTTPVSPVRADTVWFGGLDEVNGIAYNSYDTDEATAVWTWDAGTTDPLEGWTSIDVSENLDVYFSRMTEDLFNDHPTDPAVPMFPGEVGELWVGAHADEADDLGWRLGMGYGNNWRQKAWSPAYTIGAGDAIDVSFKYFQDSEVDFDYTYVNILAYSGAEADVEVYEFARLDTKHGTYSAPAQFDVDAIQYETFTTPPDSIRLELFFFADGGWSDEDGDYACDYGPFAGDDINFTVGSTTYVYDFETDEDGWIFFKVPGVGAFMDLYDETTWTTMVYNLPGAVACPCAMSGNVLHCATDIPTNPNPGHPRGQDEQLVTPIIDREGTQFTSENGWFTVLLQWDAYYWMRISAGTFLRPGFFYYPFTTVLNPTPRWSPRTGQDVWNYMGESSECREDVQYGLTVPADGTPLPYNWEQMKALVEVTCDCAGFGLTGPDDCKKEGITKGSPMFDNFRVGLTGGANAPPIVLETGHLFHDGFGQTVPQYLDPGDVCNSDVAYDISRDDTDNNDWYGDTAVVNGPPVTLPEYKYWIDLCVKVATVGPRQNMIPAYQEWKARFTGDPEVDYVCAVMDTAMTLEGATLVPVDEGQARVTYFHEDDYGFNPSYEDRTPEQEIMPDLVFTPGTRIEYYYRSYWADNPQGYFTAPNNAPLENIYEMEFLPGMELDATTPGQDYDVTWPCVLYVDAFNGGGEYAVTPTLTQLGYEFDKFDRQNFSSNYDAPLQRSFGGTQYNPGGYGNNGCTLEQLLGYRLILWNTGTMGIGAGEIPDFTILDQWLTTTECGLADTRRGLIMNGDEIAEIMADADEGLAILFCNDVLGTDVLDHAYRDYNVDDQSCVILDSISGSGEFDPVAEISVFDNDCPLVRNYNVVDAVGGGVGNLQFRNMTNPLDLTPYAQVAVEQLAGPGGAGGWKASVDGFSWHHLSQVGYGGEVCSEDTLAIVGGVADLLGPELLWIAAGGAPFDPWHYPCEDDAVDETPDTHLSGPVDFLYQSRPNPFRGTATIRFNLASERHVDIAVYDVSGRMVKTLMNGVGDQGENTVVWDGTDNGGNRVGSGIFWVKMHTPGYESTKQMVVM